VADLVARALTGDVDPLVEPLTKRMTRLAEDQRFEEAAAVRDRIDLLTRSVARQQKLGALRAAGRLTVRLSGGGGATLDSGLLTAAWPGADPPLFLEPVAERSAGDPAALPPLAVHEVDEVAAIAGWLDSNRAIVTVEPAAD
jgi:DNA polymerase-3 subunit epsilon